MLQPGYAYVPALAPQKTGEQNYHGFGLNSWQSGPQVTITRIHTRPLGFFNFNSDIFGKALV